MQPSSTRGGKGRGGAARESTALPPRGGSIVPPPRGGSKGGRGGIARGTSNALKKTDASSSVGVKVESLMKEQYERLEAFVGSNLGALIRYLIDNKIPPSDVNSLKYANPEFKLWKKTMEQDPQILLDEILSLQSMLDELKTNRSDMKKRIKRFLFDQSEASFKAKSFVLFTDEALEKVTGMHRALANVSFQIDTTKTDLEAKERALKMRNDSNGEDSAANEEKKAEELYPEFLNKILRLVFSEEATAYLVTNADELVRILDLCLSIYSRWKNISETYKDFVIAMKYLQRERSYRKAFEKDPLESNYLAEMPEIERTRKRSAMMKSMTDTTQDLKGLEREIASLEKKGLSLSSASSSSNATTEKEKRGDGDEDSFSIQERARDTDKKSYRGCDFPGCEKKAKYACSGCGKTFYCSEYHQEKDWKRHERYCSKL